MLTVEYVQVRPQSWVSPLGGVLQRNTFRSTFLSVLTVCPVTVKYVQINLPLCSDWEPWNSEIRSDQPFYVCSPWLLADHHGDANRRGRLWRTLRRDTTTSWSWRTLYESCTICLWTWPCLWRVRWDHSLEWAHWVVCCFSSFSLFMGVKPPSSLFMGVKPQCGWAHWVFPPSSVFMGVKPQSGWAHRVFPPSSLFMGVKQQSGWAHRVFSPSSLFMGVKQQSGWAHWVFPPSSLFMGDLENSVRELCDMVVDMEMLVESLMVQQSKWTDFSASSSSFRGVLDNCRRALQFVCGHFLPLHSGEF